LSMIFSENRYPLFRFKALVVSFQEVVHSALTEEAEVAEASDSEERTEWTPIRMRL
jgi:hypothetical protein